MRFKLCRNYDSQGCLRMLVQGFNYQALACRHFVSKRSTSDVKNYRLPGVVSPNSLRHALVHRERCERAYDIMSTAQKRSHQAAISAGCGKDDRRHYYYHLRTT